jgi:hypothetical protein
VANGKNPKTTGEHIVAIYGYITGLRREITSMKNNHLQHLHDDVEGINKKVDRLLFWLLGGLGAIILTLIGLFAN